MPIPKPLLKNSTNFFKKGFTPKKPKKPWKAATRHGVAKVKKGGKEKSKRNISESSLERAHSDYQL